MSDWRDVLKMPPRIDTAQNRDADYTQKIIEYDENVISPKFEEYIRSQPMNRRITGIIQMKDADGGGRRDIFKNGTYELSSETVRSLGSSITSIMQVLEKTYSQAGYKTELFANGKALHLTKD